MRARSVLQNAGGRPEGGRRPRTINLVSAERLPQHLAEPPLQRLRDRVAQRALVVALDDGAEEALDDQALGNTLRQAAGAQIEDLLRIDLGDRRGVGAADV